MYGTPAPSATPACKTRSVSQIAGSVALRLGEQGPACGNQAIGILGGHLDDAILSDGDTPARESLDRADPWWSLDADVGRFRRRFFRFSASMLEDAPVWHLAF